MLRKAFRMSIHPGQEAEYERMMMPNPEQVRIAEMNASLAHSRTNPPNTDIWSGDALNDLLVGRVQFMFATIPSVIQHIQAGKLLPVAMSSAKRSRSLPEVPTVIENGLAGFEAGSWFGFFAPKGTPEPIIAQLNRAVNDVLAMPSIEKQLIREGADPAGGTPAEFGQFVHREYEKWKLIVRESGATPE